MTLRKIDLMHHEFGRYESHICAECENIVTIWYRDKGKERKMADINDYLFRQSSKYVKMLLCMSYQYARRLLDKGIGRS